MNNIAFFYKDRLAAQSKKAMKLCAMAALAIAAPEIIAATATTPDAEFEEIFNKVSSYTNGFLGKTVCVVIALVGVVQGMRQQSLWAFVTCIAVAVGLNQLSTIIDVMFSAGVISEYTAASMSGMADTITGVSLIK